MKVKESQTPAGQFFTGQLDMTNSGPLGKAGRPAESQRKSISLARDHIKFFFKKLLTTGSNCAIMVSQRGKEVLTMMEEYEAMEYMTEDDLEDAAAWYDTQTDRGEWDAYGWEE